MSSSLDLTTLRPFAVYTMTTVSEQDQTLPLDADVLGTNRSLIPSLYLGNYHEYTVPIFGYLSPFVVLATVITNAMVGNVLAKRAMKSPVNILLLALAFADTLTALCPLPVFVHFYTFGNWVEWVHPNWCYFYKLGYVVLPTIFHTASIWLTTALAVQRYIYVCHPIKGKRMCTNEKSIRTCIIIAVLSFVVHMPRFIDMKYETVRIPSAADPSVEVDSCVEVPLAVPVSSRHLYSSLYFGFRVLFINLLPCALLIVMNGILLAVMRKARWKREDLVGRLKAKNREWRTVRESNYTTLMLVIVVGIFLLVELPLGILITLDVLQSVFHAINIFGEKEAYYVGLLHIFINFAILLSYPLNLFIYVGMSRSFRRIAHATLADWWKKVSFGHHGDCINSSTSHRAGRASSITNSEVTGSCVRDGVRLSEVGEGHRRFHRLASKVSTTSCTSA